MPPTVRSPIVMRNVLSAIAGKRSSRYAASTTSTRAASNASPNGRHAAHVAQHLRRLAENDIERHVDGRVLELRIRDLEPAVVGRLADDRVRAALALAQRRETLELIRRDDEHVALLRFVAPDLERRHARLDRRHGAQIDAAAAIAVCDRFGNRVRQAARADVVNQQDRIRLAERPALIDDFLRAPLDLGVAALHRREVEILRARAAADRGRRAAAQADQHRRTAEHDDFRARRHVGLLDVHAAHVAEPARDHDRLVIAAQRGARAGSSSVSNVRK